MNNSFRQELAFGLMMTVGMVAIMLSYNAIWTFGFTVDALVLILREFVPIFVVAFIVEQLIVSHNAHKLHKVVASPNDAQFKNIIKLSIIMVTGMCLSMTLYATLTTVGTEGGFWNHYLQALARNYPVALLAQLVVVGPLVRLTHTKLFNSQLAS